MTIATVDRYLRHDAAESNPDISGPVTPPVQGPADRNTDSIEPRKVGRISLIMPVRNAQARLVTLVENTLEQFESLTSCPLEIIIVDDGSTDRTSEVIDDLSHKFPQIRGIRHGSPRGMEAAGQSGLERCVGELVFIQESELELRTEDLRRLLQLADDDETILAARAEADQPAPTAPLIRRLRQWASNADQQVAEKAKASAVQMIRRPHLNKLLSKRGESFQIASETIRIKSRHASV